MREYSYINKKGVFCINNPELTSYLYFPIANERGVMSSVTPTLGGDSKLGQNTFLLAPVSSEDLHNNKSSRNFWCSFEGLEYWSATGKSSWQEALLFTKRRPRSLRLALCGRRLPEYLRNLGLHLKSYPLYLIPRIL